MKTILTLALLCGSLALAAPDPCQLLSPGEVKSGLGAPTVTAQPASDEDFPTCNFDFQDGSLMVQVISPAGKLLQGKSLLTVMESGDSSIQDLKAVTGLGDEAAGVGSSSTTDGVLQDGATLFVRKGENILMLMAVSSNHTASKVNLPSLILLAKRALLRLH